MVVSTKRRPSRKRASAAGAVPTIPRLSPPDVVLRFNPVYAGDVLDSVLCEAKVVGGSGWVHVVLLAFDHSRRRLRFETHMHPSPIGPNLMYIEDKEFVEAYLSGMQGRDHLDVVTRVLWVSPDGMLHDTESRRRLFGCGDVTA